MADDHFWSLSLVFCAILLDEASSGAAQLGDNGASKVLQVGGRNIGFLGIKDLLK